MDKNTQVPAVRVGVDLSKRVIQVQAVDASSRVLTNRALARDKFLPWCAQLPPGCLVVTEVSSSAHHWARALRAMGLDARIVSAHLAAPHRLHQSHPWLAAGVRRGGAHRRACAEPGTRGHPGGRCQ